MKDYATETDIITTPDPLFYPGDQVVLTYNEPMAPLTVESFAWNTLKHSWTYTLVYFLNETTGMDMRWNGTLAVDEAFEKELRLVSRKKFTK